MSTNLPNEYLAAKRDTVEEGITLPPGSSISELKNIVIR